MYKRIMWWFAVIGWMLVIFSFSAQSSGESSKLSSGLTDKIVEFIKRLESIQALSVLGKNSIEKLADIINHLIRKAAHFGVFAVLGVFVYGLLASYNINRKTIVVTAVFICLVYAASDEIHQYFVPGRACRLSDVLIDTTGALASTLLFHFINGRKLMRKLIK